MAVIHNIYNRGILVLNKKKVKSFLSTAFLVLVLFLGLGIMLYPYISDKWNSVRQTHAISDYNDVVSNMDEKDYHGYFDKAEEYNKKIQSMAAPLVQYNEVLDEYYNALDITGTGVIGYISIESIDVELPIYHGTKDDVLNIAVGHLEGTTFPIGGESTHAVLSAHRGLPSAKLFSDLDDMAEGDIFTITVLDKVVTYQVDQILTVLPQDTKDLEIVEGKDYCTLMTCTPYGVNTHRLLVRGKRIDNIIGPAQVIKDALRISSYWVIAAVTIPLLILLFFIVLLSKNRKKKGITADDVTAMAEQKLKERREQDSEP